MNSEYFVSTLQIQGQIYHKVGSLLPFPDANYQFLQIYFIGNSDEEIDARCAFTSNTRRVIVGELQELFHQHNELIRMFKTALDKMPSDNHKIVIRADKTPVGEHAGRYNAPANDEVAIVIVGEEFQSRDIVLHRRNNQLQRVSETHRFYDALQYPILFCRGEDGYAINIKMKNPATGGCLSKLQNSLQFLKHFSFTFAVCNRDFTKQTILAVHVKFHATHKKIFFNIKTK